MDLVEHVHDSGFTNIHTFDPNISIIMLFSLIFNYAITPNVIVKLNFIYLFVTIPQYYESKLLYPVTPLASLASIYL